MERRFHSIALILLLALGTLTLSGCIGFAANLLYMFQGMKVDAAYPGLKKSRVAVIVVSDASSYGPDTLTNVIGRAMSNRLSQVVKGIKVIPQSEIENWKDVHGWDELDFLEIGRGLNVDRVLALEIDSYSIREGTTMYKGRAMLTATVYDLQREGDVAFTVGPSEFQFPRSHGRPALSVSERQFEAEFLSRLVESLSRNFYDHDRVDAIAEDASTFD